MRISDGEIRGTIGLAAILLAISAIAWLKSPAGCSSGNTSGAVLFPEDSVAAAVAPTQYNTERSSIVKDAQDTIRQISKKSRAKGSRPVKRHKSSQPQPDRPSPLDSPVTP